MATTDARARRRDGGDIAASILTRRRRAGWRAGMESDDELVARVLAGDREAFGVLMARHGALVRAIAARYLPRGGDVEVEDAAQEVFLRAWSRLATYRSCGRFGPWVATIAANYCHDIARRRRFVAATLDLLPPRADPAPGPEDAALRAELGEALAAVLGQLSPAQRGAVVLCCGQGLTLAEAAAAAFTTPEAIKTRVYYGRQKLRGLLGTL